MIYGIVNVVFQEGHCVTELKEIQSQLRQIPVVKVGLRMYAALSTSPTWSFCLAHSLCST